MLVDGHLIRNIRTQRGLSQQALAEQVGITKSYISELESGRKQRASDDIVRRIYAFLGIPLSDEPLAVRIARLSSDIESGEYNAEECLTRVQSLLSEVNDDTCVTAGDLYLTASKLYKRIGRLSEAMRYVMLAIDTFSRTGDVLRWCQASYESAIIDYDKGNYDRALERGRIIEERMLRLNLKEYLLARVQALIALIGAIGQDLDLVNDYLQRCESSLALVPLERRDKFVATTEYLRAYTLLQAKAYNDALDAFNRSYQIYRSINLAHDALSLRHSIAEVNFHAGNIDRAWEVASEVLDEKIEAGQSESSIARTVILLAEIAFARGDYLGVVTYCKSVLDGEIDAKEKAQAYRFLARVKKSEGNIAAFNEYMTRAVTELQGSTIHQALTIEIITEYMQVNHLPNVFDAVR